MTVQEVLKQYDRRDRKGFYLYKLRNSLSQVSDEEKTSDAYKYEMLAFSLVGTPNSKYRETVAENAVFWSCMRF